MSAIGLDLGTSRVKAVRFDATWHAVDQEAEATLVERPRPGWSEQRMPEVWAAAARVLQAVAQRSPDAIELIAITGQGDGCWLIDAPGEPIGPALLWNDGRATEVLAQWERDGTLATAFRINGCYGSSGLANAQLRWLAEHEPGALRRATHLLSCSSWIYLQLTGRRVLDTSEAANPFLDAETGRYDPTLLGLYGLADYGGLLPEIVTGADRIAPLRADTAASLGLVAGTPVALTPYDVVTSTIGTGITRPGQGVAILGTTVCPAVVRDTPSLDRAPNGITLPAGAPRRWLVAFPTMVGTEVLDWATSLLGLRHIDDLMALASTAETLASDRPLLLPYLSPAGERSPFLHPGIRGSLHGLTTAHTRADIARSTVDGLSLAVRDCVAVAGGATTIALAGGGARSELWASTIADATGSTVACPDTAEVGARGAVLVGATDLGQFTDIDQAVAVVSPGHTHAPDLSLAAVYDELFARYRDTRTRLHGV